VRAIAIPDRGVAHRGDRATRTCASRELTHGRRLHFAITPADVRRFDKRQRFVLDIAIFSSIIYIWYEGRRLKPRVVTQLAAATLAEHIPSGGPMAKKTAKKAAKKAAKKTVKKAAKKTAKKKR